MKQYLLNFLKEAVELDFDRLPNLVYMRHLKAQLRKQADDFGWGPNIEKTISAVLGNMDINFSALGGECSEEDDKYLLELATLTAKCVWKVYDRVPDELGFDVFIKLIQGFNISLT